MTYTNLADDLLEGVDQIAEFLGKRPRQVEHLLRCGALPVVFRIGTMVWHARKSSLTRLIAELEANASEQSSHSRRDISSDTPVVASDLNTTATAM